MIEKSGGSEASGLSVIDDGKLMFAFAHDLRTHLRTVVTRLQLLQSGSAQALSVEDQSLLQEAASAAVDIDCLLNAMVAYCGVSASPSATTSLSLLLRGLLIERKSMLSSAGAEVEVANQLDPQVPSTLTTVLKELLTNACRFRDSTRPLRIRIAVEFRGGSLEIAVSDNGLGVALEDLEKLFIPFHRLHPRDKFPGCGLGLATCRRIAESWGGNITAGRGADAGLTVCVFVPIHPET